MHARTFRSVAALALALCAGPALVLAGSDPAGASCTPPEDVPTAIAKSDIVVVGTVTSTRSQNRIATIHAEEIWKGDVDPSFEVFGGPSSGNMATSVDRTYDIGGRYLLFAHEPAAHGDPPTFGGRYEDSSCSTTQTWSDALGQFRPTTATIVGRDQDGGPPVSTRGLPPAPRPADLGWWLAAGIIGSGLVVTVAVISWWRKASVRKAQAGANH